VALFGIGIADANNSSVWGLNTALSDNRGQLVSSGLGRSLNNELDLNFTSPNSTGFGLVVQGASIAQPAFAVGFSCGPLDLFDYAAGTTINAKWSECLSTTDAAGVVGLSIGKTAKAGANLNSQIVQLGYSDASGTPQNINFHANTIGGLTIQNTSGSIVGLTAPSGFSNRAGTDQNLLIRGPIDLSDGVSLFSVNDENNAVKSMEIVASTIKISAVNVSITSNLIIPFGTPESANSACMQGQITFDAAYIYTCVATNTWHRLANGATW
jgi:hypothetical protein